MDIPRFDRTPAREEQGVKGLRKSDLDADPIRQFGHWFAAALEAKVPEPNALTLATATLDGTPSARIVLLKEFDQRGFVFYTNYQSQKGRELAENPSVALVFFWPTLERQVRIVGAASQVSREESESYFHSRPAGSQLGAWASHQSQVLPDRSELDGRVAELERRYANGIIPLPPFWGGFRVAPRQIEFWQARVNRLHDRFRYRRGESGAWILERLSP
jgi:pyridoxamine 5'-phosphate oxidase